MTTPVADARADRRSGAGQERRRGTGARIGLFALTALVAGATGVAGTLAYQRSTAPDTSAVDAQAAGLAEDLRGDLNAGFFSGGRPYGGRFTAGTLVAQVEARGGVLLSADTEQSKAAGRVHTAEVMLGLVPPSGTESVTPEAYPVRCYRYTFALGTHSVKQSGTPCPASRTDGRPGSIAAQMGALLAQRPTGTSAYRPLPTSGHEQTPRGAVEFLKDMRLVTARDTVSAVSGRAGADGVYAVALRINGTCHYLRMDSASTSSRLVPLWPAPADEQPTCNARQATAAATLYGTDPAEQG
ncbi:hypothetical protein ACGF1Z_22720 [Streptomyces sp. NPDC048018]|uniref:hypothetical protein n=1 Tax=Streptomyces sp. NPDC048018 TaxID=3365499 RepID=UPI00371469D8